jgi:RNA polymerase sigma-70 factor (ECF subfamily)
MEWVTTSTILHGLRDFDNATAWEQFVERFRPTLNAFVGRVGVRPADVDDVVQESLVAFAESHRGGRYERNRGRLSRWLFGIAYRQAMRQLRRYGSGEVHPETQPGETSFLDKLPDERSATDLWERIWEEHLVLDCLRRIREESSPRSYRIFELAVLRELSASEVADQLGIEIKAVYNEKHRTLRRIREIRAELESVG